MTLADTGRPGSPALAALHQRLAAVAPLLDGPVLDGPVLDGPAGDEAAGGWSRVDAGVDGGVDAEATGRLLHRLVESVAADHAPDRVWLLLVGLSGTFPLDDDVVALRRHLELRPPGEVLVHLLDWAHEAVLGGRAGHHELRLVQGGVVVDVDISARTDVHTGIQRVVRRLMPRWCRDHGDVVEPVVWSDTGTVYRPLAEHELDRVLRWRGPLRMTVAPAPPSVVTVPWRSTVVLPEVPGSEQCARLASLARHSGNTVTAVGYDTIPVVSADLMPASEPRRFVRYLTLVKHAAVVAGISDSAAAEFRGFADALPSQGLTGPRVVACHLAADDAPAVDDEPAGAAGEPEVLVVGSHEPRKNHLAVLQAAEILWREGLDFHLRFIGASGWTTHEFDARLDELAAAGRPVASERGVHDEELWEAYRRARFTVFPSLHEGYGLPVVESLNLGTPVIGTDFGSIAELGRDGGMLLADPRDDDALAAGMRALLTDDDLLAELRRQIGERPVRTWDDYAAELWQRLVVEA